MIINSAPRANSPISDQIANLIALAKDPDVYAEKLAKLEELRAAEASAGEAIEQAAKRKAELDQREHELASRADVLGRQAAQLETDAGLLAKDRADFNSEQTARAAKLSDLGKALNARETELDTRAAAISKQEISAASLHRAAQTARDAADARLAELRSIVQSFEPIRARLAALM